MVNVLFIVGVLFFGLNLWGLVYICRVRHRGLYRGRSLVVALAIGIVLGVAADYASYMENDYTRICGVPLMYAIFLRRGDYWDDFVGPLTLPCLLGNFLIGLGLPLDVLAFVVMRKKSKLPSPAS